MTVEKHNERKAWRDLPKSQKSYTVSVLHHFHYRPNRIAASWRQEEVLTWELYYALRVLPRRLFLKPLIDRIGKLDESTATVAKALGQDLSNLNIEYSPSLCLKGVFHNSCSDIGIISPKGAALWIEAKTKVIQPSQLDQQLRKQRAALSKIYGAKHSQVVALIPSRQKNSSWPSVRWLAVLDIVKQCRVSLGIDESSGLAEGLVLVASELEGRIAEHERIIAH